MPVSQQVPWLLSLSPLVEPHGEFSPVRLSIDLPRVHYSITFAANLQQSAELNKSCFLRDIAQDSPVASRLIVVFPPKEES